MASGAGTTPSWRAKSTPASKHDSCFGARASIRPLSFRCDTSGAMTWERRPPAWNPGGMKVEPLPWAVHAGPLLPSSSRYFTNTTSLRFSL